MASLIYTKRSHSLRNAWLKSVFQAVVKKEQNAFPYGMRGLKIDLHKKGPAPVAFPCGIVDWNINGARTAETVVSRIPCGMHWIEKIPKTGRLCRYLRRIPAECGHEINNPSGQSPCICYCIKRIVRIECQWQNFCDRKFINRFNSSNSKLLNYGKWRFMFIYRLVWPDLDAENGWRTYKKLPVRQLWGTGSFFWDFRRQFYLLLYILP